LTSTPHELVAEALRAVSVHSLDRYEWFGTSPPRLPVKVKAVLGPDGARQRLLATLSLQLYRDFYCVGRPTPGSHDDTVHIASTSFVAQLADANTGRGYDDATWEVSGVDSDGAVVSNGTIAVRVDDRERRFELGERLSLHMPSGFTNLAPGFYTAIGDAGPARSDVGRERRGLIRLYFNLSPAGAILLMRDVTRKLNAMQVPFRCKMLNDPRRFTRCDAVVLYVDAANYELLRSLVEELHSKLRPFLAAPVPAFTKRLADGIGLAEDPQNGESFGLHRCGLLADGIIEAWEQRARSVEERLEVVVRRFARERLDLGAPFLNPGSDDRYAFTTEAIVADSAQRRPRARTRFATTDFLGTAAAIGETLVRDAVWHEHRCSWIGAGPTADGATPAAIALGPDLYAGTSGVGLFLGALAAVAGGSSAFSRTATGALRHALSRLEPGVTSTASGLYTGALGILVVSALIGRLLDSDDLVSESASGLSRIASDEYEEPSDLVAGRAGAVVALLALSAILNDEAHVDTAMRLGDDLIRCANQGPDGCSWPSASHRSGTALTGLAHGAAGVGYALAELFAVSGEDRYRGAALEAFRYERQWFDSARGNWLDLREGAAATAGEPPCAFHWCHGAPGIALSRARAYDVLGDLKCRIEADVGATTTRRSLEHALAERRGNYSLCHGLCGNADAAVTVAELLGSEPGAARSLALQVAATGAAGYLRTGVEWPCGSVGTTPGLMLGLAGIGYFYLRLHEPRLPSPLLVSLWPRFASI
jgi:hypothetical protein